MFILGIFTIKIFQYEINLSIQNKLSNQQLPHTPIFRVGIQGHRTSTLRLDTFDGPLVTWSSWMFSLFLGLLSVSPVPGLIGDRFQGSSQRLWLSRVSRETKTQPSLGNKSPWATSCHSLHSLLLPDWSVTPGYPFPSLLESAIFKLSNSNVFS